MTDWWAETTTPKPTPAKVDWWEETTARPAELRSGPGPKGGWTNIVPADDVSKSARSSAVLEASLQPDVDKQIQVYAKARGIDPRRYGVDKDGNIVFMDPNNNDRITREIPSVGGSTGIGDFFKRIGLGGMSMVGPSVPQVAAGTVATAMGPTGMSIPAAAATAGVVDQGRQMLGNLISGFDVLDTNLASSGGQALMAGIPQAATVGINKAVTRNPLGAGTGDLSVLKDPARYNQFQQTDDLMRSQGISATPAEITNARSLLARQRQLGRFDETATTMDDFYRMRNEQQIPTAFNRTMNQISPEASAAQGARRLQEGAGATIDAANKARADAASPLYKEAFSANKDMASPVIDRILATPAGKDALAGARERMQNRMSLMATPDADLTDQMRLLAEIGKMEKVPIGVSKGLKLETLDLVKQELDDMINQAKLAAQNGTGRAGVARDLTELKQGLVRQLDELDETAKAGPNSTKPEGGAYARARAAYGGASAEVDTAKDGLVGLAAADRAAGMQNVPRTMFDIARADPLSTASARSAFEKAGKLDDWNAGLRAYLTDTFASSQKNQNIAGSYYRAIAGDPRQAATLKAAMSPEQHAVFKDFTEALNVVRRALPEGAPTATDLGGKEAFAGAAARTIGRAPKLLSPQNLGENISDFITSRSASKNAEIIANVITQPGAIAELKKLRALSPTSQKALTIMDDVIANYGIIATGAGRPSEQRPAAYRE